MAKNCFYCKAALTDNDVLDVCKRCGYQVWGEKMFATIVKNMENAKEAGDLNQGSVSTSPSAPKKSLRSEDQKNPFKPLSSFSSSSTNSSFSSSEMFDESREY